MMRALALTLALALPLATAAQEAVLEDDAALAAVEACRARLDPAVDIGIERIARRCPQLLPALERAPWRELLPRDLRARREDVTAGSLRALAQLVRQAAREDAWREPPARADLDPILAELDTAERSGTNWQRFKRWLAAKFEVRRTNDTGWLDELLADLRTSEGLARALTWLGYALVLALVGYVVWAELRAAGLLGGTRRAAARSAADAARWGARVTLADVAAAPLIERPGLMLRLLGDALTRAHLLPGADGLSASAIAQRAQLRAAADREVLANLAATADEVRYAERVPPQEALASTTNAARDLLTRIERARGAG